MDRPRSDQIRSDHPEFMTKQLVLRHRNSSEILNLSKHLRESFRKKGPEYNLDTAGLSDKGDANAEELPFGQVPIWIQVDDKYPVSELLELIEQSYIKDPQASVTVINSSANENIFGHHQDIAKWAKKSSYRKVVDSQIHMRGCEDQVIIYFHSLGYLNELISRARETLIIVTIIG